MKKAAVFSVLAIGLIMALYFVACSPKQERAVTPIDKSALQRPKEYVGAKRCGECHDKIYWTWRATKHPYKITEPNEKTVVGDFVYHNTLELVDKRDGQKKIVAKMYKKNGKFYVQTFADKDQMQEFEIVYNIGGVWKQRYMTKFPNGALQVLPVQWNVKTREWVDYHGLKKHQPGDGKYWSEPTRTWQRNCAKCHVTGFKMNFKDGKYNSTWSDNGAACEACHGPGSHHVNTDDAHKLGTIFNPAKFHDDRRATMVCGSCHSRGKSPDHKFGYPNTYKVGDELSFHYVQVTPEKNKNRFWPDGSSKSHHQQFTDFRKSVMFSKGVKCWSCHDPHKPSEGNAWGLRLTGNALCMSCHGANNGNAKLSHSLHNHNNCVGCHMPRTAKSATPGDISSHTFFAIPPTTTAKLGGGDAKKQPNSCNLCHYHSKTPVEKLVKDFDNAHKDKASYDGGYVSIDTDWH